MAHPSFEKLLGEGMLDYTEPEAVEVLIADGRWTQGPTVWVNVNGVCRFRACRVKVMQLKDDRKKPA